MNLSPIIRTTIIAPRRMRDLVYADVNYKKETIISKYSFAYF